MRDLTYIIAGRSKPVQLCTSLEKVLENKVLKETKIIVSLDEDDLFTVEYAQKYFGASVDYSILPREDGFGDKWNRALEISPSKLYACGFDDESIITKGWDERFLESFKLLPEDGIGAIYNHLINASFPSAPAYSDALARKLGYIYPPYFPFWFIDHWMDEILRLIQRISFVDIRTEQTFGRGKTRCMRDLKFWGEFFDNTRILRVKLAKDIIESEDFCETKRRKSLLLNNIEMMLPKLIIMNQYVRHNYEGIEKVSSEDAPLDDRTKRALARAKDFLSMQQWQTERKVA